ncbi:hypothetical protein BDD12DRAFT_879918 [Trichophaea hybrida]|nr:hypothetical protein BDD12DRAFT_879918 [Trichophaea hybrida]
MSEQRDSLSETGGSGHHNIVLTPDEKKVFGQLFQAADTENLGVVTGELAVKFFEKSGLNPRILGEIWGIADTENRGLLTKFGFSVALRLIGQAQNGQHPRPELSQQPGPLPRFEGVNIVYPPPPTTSSPPPPPVLPTQPTGPGGMIRVPPLLPQDVERFTALFEKSGVVDGILQGNIARDIFQRSRLPNSTLIQIWNLADRQGRGALGCVEFVVAMHLITSCKNGSLPALPQILPPGLYDAASGRPPTRNGPDRRQPGRTMPPVPPIPKQFSGPQAQRAQSPLSRNFTPPVPQNANAIQRDITGGGWAVLPADKQRFDSVFLTVDKANRGVITGEEAVPFFGNSGLPEDVLAQIWDLADINKAGQLNRDEFAIAMYLIVQQRSNPGVPLPEVLPPNLIPPSMRQQRQLTGPPVAQPPSPFDPAPQPPPPPKSAADDLFGLDSFTSVAQPQAGPGPNPTAGPFDGDVFGSKEASPTVSAAHSPIPSQGSGLFGRPTPTFVPTSSFGQSIMPVSTGGSNHSGPSRGFPQQPKPQEMDDLLGDADPEVSNKLTNESTELANLSNQIGTLTKQTQELQTKRLSAETDLSSLATKKQHIEAQLVQLRAAYQKEAAAVKRVEDELAHSRNDTNKATQEYQRIEAEYNQLQYKRQEISSQLEADKRENENLKERMNLINAENRSLKEELERLELQARRERGMVAINRKQVEKSESEQRSLKNGIEETTRSNATSPIPPASPTLSQGSVNNKNPFQQFNRKSPPVTDSNFGSNSPFGPARQAPTSMDDVFGPTFSSTPPPQTSFASRPPPDSSSYTPSVPESGHGGRSTPPTSPPASSYHSSPQLSEAPPPAVGSQITSAYLPLPISRADSVTSSVQVNPSASVRDSQFSRPDTPTNMFGSATADSPARDRDAFGKAEDRRSSFSVKSDAGTEASGRAAFSPFDRRNDSPFAPVEKNTTGTTSGGDENKPKLEKTDSSRDFSSLPGAFPTYSDSGTPIKPMPTGESTMSNRSRMSNASRSAFNASSDPFSLEGTRAASSKDLDDAFGKFPKVDPHHTGGSGSISASKFHDEFPPIKEIQPDSDSDSDGGFEDNFNSQSPAKSHAKLSSTTPTNANQGPKFDDTTTESQPPPITAQQPPPGYSQVPGGQDKSPYSAEFGGLLPSRSDPMKHDAPTPGGSTNAVVFPSTTAAAADDDFDESAFGDLAEAKEADDKTDNDFGTPLAFDDDFNPIFDLPTSAKNANQTPGMAISGDDDFAGFTFNVDGSSQPPQAHGDSPVALPAKPLTSQDWDDLFVNFDGQPSATPANAQASQPGKENLPTKGANGTSDQSGTDPGEGGVSLSSSSDSAPAPAPTSVASAAPVGTATTIITAEGGSGGVKVASDDDKVTKLTGMGFDRESSVKALENNGWNIDRVSSP